MSGGNWKEMYQAGCEGDLALVEYHVKAGADVNYAHPEFLSTPLVAAILAGQQAVALYLLDHGANPELPSEFDAATPMQAARRAGLQAVEDRLCELGVQRPAQELRARSFFGRLIDRARGLAPALLGGLLVAGLAGPAEAQDAGGDGNMVVTRSPLGAWILKEDAANPRLNCAIRFVPSRARQPGLAIFGPTASSPSATILFSSADIPWSQAVQDVQVELQQHKLPSVRMKARLLARETGAPQGHLAVGTGDIRQTLKSMRDSETELHLRLNNTLVFSLDYDGLELARNAMLDCIEGRRFAGRTLKEGTAELRPVGASTIKGQAFVKQGLLARKQYPPKGSPAVGLIWMTDEFKAWYDHVKATKKLPGQIPESIAKHFMSVRILDDEGRFAFTNLPAGEYIVVANFSYEKTVTRQEYAGTTHTFVGNAHIGSTDRYLPFSYLVQEGASFEKPVRITKDGDVVELSMDKSQLFCFLVCF
jgi:hypothetical protein